MIEWPGGNWADQCPLTLLRSDPAKFRLTPMEKPPPADPPPSDADRRAALAALVREHEPFLRAMALRLCRTQLDPGDLVQDVLERLVTNAERIPADVPVRAWLTRVMHNRFIDLVRRSRAVAPVATEELASPEPEVEPWWHSLSARDVHERIAALPEELREAFRLYTVDGLSYLEVSERLGISRNTVGTRILRARRRIRAMFTGVDDE